MNHLILCQLPPLATKQGCCLDIYVGWAETQGILVCTNITFPSDGPYTLQREVLVSNKSEKIAYMCLYIIHTQMGWVIHLSRSSETPMPMGMAVSVEVLMVQNRYHLKHVLLYSLPFTLPLSFTLIALCNN